jgi:small subunit ribosomal protein S16
MAVAIRLRREGAKDRPYYRVVVADSRSRRDGRYIEAIGNYDPMHDGAYDIDLAKAEEWIGNGAKPSETVLSLIRKARKAATAAS